MPKPEYQELIESPEQLPALGQLIRKGLQAGPVVVTLGRKKRTNDQNRKLWPMLTDLSKQAEHCGMKFSPEDWKDLVTGSFEQLRPVPGLDGGVVMLGGKTSQYTKAKFAELIEYIYSVGYECGVTWSEPALKVYKEMQNDRQKTSD